VGSKEMKENVVIVCEDKQQKVLKVRNSYGLLDNWIMI
jgi:hypothetical protein